MKHIKLFESFGSSTIFSPEDSSLPGDNVFCWNFEDGWMVSLLNRSLSEKMFEYLGNNKSRLVTRVKYSSQPGICFVTTGITPDLKVQFKGDDFIPSSVDFFVNSQGDNEILSGEYPNSCAFTLKRNHVIGYMWNGGHLYMPIEDYLSSY